MEKVSIGVIGGSGVYQIEQLTDVKKVNVDTPFGPPSDCIIIGKIKDVRVAFLPRHGVGHRILPSEVNYRANIFALKKIGVKRLISISACGSMREDYAPRDIVIPDQIFDFTRNRQRTFFGEGIVAHIGFADPFCPVLSRLLLNAVEKTDANVHFGGTLITIEGPRFSSKGESNIYRKWGVDLIGMTAMPEAILAREAEMCYATMAHVTDYDVWHETEKSVSIDMLVENLQANTEITKSALTQLVPTIPKKQDCACASALENAIFTAPEHIPQIRRDQLDVLVKKYI
ncbi:S-methyl-5'-thioadenosine phosphorylase [candidate division KSB1 bacterium]|nr:S-methyl-5'-thioadenosine phosphorylase [candidate division KSB1 bacterium]